MPIDPATGQQLPYQGDPGAPAGAPPMPPGGPGAPMGAPPPPGAAPGGAPVDDLAAAEQQEAMAKMEAIAATAPVPSKPYSIKAIQTFAGEVDAAIDFLAGVDIPLPAWEPDQAMVEKGGKWMEPLPLEVYAPAVALVEAVKMVSGEAGGKFDKHVFEPTELDSDAALKAASGKARSMTKDKALMKALQAPVEGEEGGEAPAEEAELPAAEEMSSEDKELMEAM